MKWKLILIFAITLSLSVTAKNVKISVIPSDAKIFVDGNYVADGITTAKIKTSDGFLVLKFEKEGYVTLDAKVFASDSRKAISFTMKRDEFLENSIISGNSNRFFTQEISDSYIKKTGDSKEASTLVWKMLHQIILNYFEEIETSDQLSGFIQTPWTYKTFANAGFQVRTRITIKESNIGGALTYKMKVSSETAPLNSSLKDEFFRETPRILKTYEPIISEFQSRLGKL